MESQSIIHRGCRSLLNTSWHLDFSGQTQLDSNYYFKSLVRWFAWRQLSSFGHVSMGFIGRVVPGKSYEVTGSFRMAGTVGQLAGCTTLACRHADWQVGHLDNVASRLTSIPKLARLAVFLVTWCEALSYSVKTNQTNLWRCLSSNM